MKKQKRTWIENEPRETDRSIRKFGRAMGASLNEFYLRMGGFTQEEINAAIEDGTFRRVPDLETPQRKDKLELVG